MTAPLPPRSVALPAVLAASAHPVAHADHATSRRQLLRRAGALALLPAAALPLALGGCASHDIETYRADKPVLDLRSYFNGTLDAYGIFTDRSGQVVRRFTVVMVCTWQGDQGVLDEAFTYSDGTTERRVWRLTQWPDGRYTGTAGDVWARPRARLAATPSAGATPCACRWTEKPTTCSLTTGCS